MEEVVQGTIGKLNTSRIASIEFLRSLAMLMVITLHYLDKGGILVSLAEKQTFAGVCAWLLESFCAVAVNTYVLISGYFLVESGFKLRRLIILAAQLVFYSVLVPVVLVLCGILPVSELTVYHLLNYFFPIQMNHYWFGTAYVFMYILVPVLSAGIKQLSQKQLKIIITIAIIVFSISKTILPFQLEMDKAGYDVTWFICLFLIASYIRLYGIKWINKGSRGFVVYGLSCVGILCLSMAIAFAGSCLGKFEYFIDSPFDYNHVLCLLGSVGLFLGFLYWKMPEGKVARFACKISPYTFGVYLLHENREIRYLWPQWLGVDKFVAGTWSVFHWLISIFIVFAVGILVDYLRSFLFDAIEKIIVRSKEQNNWWKG